eukprot:gene5964-4273_t
MLSYFHIYIYIYIDTLICMEEPIIRLFYSFKVLLLYNSFFCCCPEVPVFLSFLRVSEICTCSVLLRLLILLSSHSPFLVLISAIVLHASFHIALVAFLLHFSTSMSSRRRQGDPSSPQPRIDYSKYKTKICRHYQFGSCPFEDRCAFSHGDDASPEMSPEASPRHPRRVKSESTMISDEHDHQSESTSNSDTSPIPPPPAYEVATLTDCMMETLLYYPSRFRYDPYSYDGIRVENERNSIQGSIVLGISSVFTPIAYENNYSNVMKLVIYVIYHYEASTQLLIILFAFLEFYLSVVLFLKTCSFRTVIVVFGQFSSLFFPSISLWAVGLMIFCLFVVCLFLLVGGVLMGGAKYLFSVNDIKGLSRTNCQEAQQLCVPPPLLQAAARLWLFCHCTLFNFEQKKPFLGSASCVKQRCVMTFNVLFPVFHFIFSYQCNMVIIMLFLALFQLWVFLLLLFFLSLWLPALRLRSSVPIFFYYSSYLSANQFDFCRQKIDIQLINYFTTFTTIYYYYYYFIFSVVFFRLFSRGIS